jgi:O-antigen/teichoic acid export membrane protein
VLFLGARWHGAAPIYALLGLAGIIQPLANSTGWLFISQGRTMEMFRWSVVGGTLTIASFAVGLPWGAVGVAAAYGLAGPLVIAPLLFWYVSRRGPVSQADLYRTLALPLTAAAAVGASILGLRRLSALANPIVGLAVSLPVAIAVSLIVYAIHPRGRKSLSEARQLLFQTIRPDRQAPSPETPSAAVGT